MYDSYGHRSGSGVKKQMHYSPNLLSTIQNALEHYRVASLEYDSAEKGVTFRDIEPMALVFKDGKRHLVGWCRLREDYRSFRLDRLNCVKVRMEEFIPRDDFDISRFQEQGDSGHSDQWEEEYN